MDMGEGLRTQALLRLMAWMSPAFPIGGFAYSGGLERAVHDRLVVDAAGLRSWLATLLRHGALWNDAVLFCHAWRGHGSKDDLREAAELGLALSGSAERHLETLRAWQKPTDQAQPPLPLYLAKPDAAHQPRRPAGIGFQEWQERQRAKRDNGDRAHAK